MMPANLALQAAREGNHEAFAQLAEPHRYELQVHGYRMLGCLQDAEDMVQETMFRAWKRLETYNGRAPFRAWLYKIATNICLDSLGKKSRRVLSLTLTPNDPSQPLPAPIPDPIWLDPLPEEWLNLTGVDPSPEAHYTQRESVTLAFMTALQRLPPRQRAVLILCDVLDWQARETTELLNMSLSAVNSVLFRARATLGNAYSGETLAPPDDFTTALLTRYVHAWENADVNGLVSLLKEEAAFAMPPFPVWFRGRADIRDFLTASLLDGEARGRWKLVQTQANAQPAFAFYRRAEDGYHAFGLQVLSLDSGQITAMTHFLDEGLFARFGLPFGL